jgi:hypothetical protein
MRREGHNGKIAALIGVFMKTYVALLMIASGVLVSPAAVDAQERIPPSTLPYPLVSEFKGPPPPATARPDSACKAAEHYSTLIRSRRAKEVPDLFAEDGVLLTRGEVRRGRKEIHGFYDALTGTGATPIAFIDSGAECFMELASRQVDADIWRITAVDHFTVAPDGKIARLLIYSSNQQTGAPASGAPTRR